tara:strand:+ start:2896 stop:3135 length:240 start_codon:yes stop_codon:yes gene_type:complete
MTDDWMNKVQAALNNKNVARDMKKVFYTKLPTSEQMIANQIKRKQPVGEHHLRGLGKQRLLETTDITEQDFKDFLGDDY